MPTFSNMQLFLLSLLFIMPLTLPAMPEYFQALSKMPPQLPEHKPAWQDQQSAWQASEADLRQGFAWAVEDISLNPHPGYMWPAQRPEQRVKQFLMRGEQRGVWLIVRALRDLPQLSLTAKSLHIE